jgi:hypothetical protein
MISNDAIHVQAEEKWKDGNVDDIGMLETNDYFCAVHDVWWRAKLDLATYKQPQLGQRTHKRCWWDGWALGVGVDDW